MMRLMVIVIVASLLAALRLGAGGPSAEVPAHGAPENVIRVTERIVSGGVPVGDGGFDHLAAMGVKTILSVDGGPPDVERARARGMRYVHLPVGYHGIGEERRLEIARAVRDLPGPVYVHCHHGVHRGPAAAAVAAVLLGELAAEQGLAFLRVAGTAESYTGLYSCVNASAAATEEMLDAASAEFPEIAPTPEFVKAMAAAQQAYEHLQEVRDAEWATPEDHPDLVPLAEAGRLEGLMRALLEDPRKDEHPEDFAAMLIASHARTVELEAAMGAGADRAELSKRLKAVGASCKECHVVYRDE